MEESWSEMRFGNLITLLIIKKSGKKNKIELEWLMRRNTLSQTVCV